MIAFTTFIHFKAGPPGLLRSLVLSLPLLILTPAAHAQTQALRVSAIPDEAPTELTRKFQPLGRYLAEKISMKVDFVPVTDYAAVVESLAARKLDMAWLGGAAEIMAIPSPRSGAMPWT